MNFFHKKCSSGLNYFFEILVQLNNSSKDLFQQQKNVQMDKNFLENFNAI